MEPNVSAVITLHSTGELGPWRVTLMGMSPLSELFAGPVEVMLCRAQEAIPTAAALAGGTVLEPKWDGFRAVLQVTPEGRTTIWSRNGTNLSTAFSDAVEAARNQVPAGVVLDGELVVWVDGRLSFDHLQQRMAARPAAVARLARQHPASYVAFDILAVAGTDLRDLRWRDRRQLLDELATGFEPPIQVSPYTEDQDVALEWFTALAPAGVEGLVAKGAATRYRPRERGSWVKVKHRSQIDGIVGAVIGPVTKPESIVVGRYTAAGLLRIVGRSTALTSQQASALAGVLTEVAGSGHPWPAEIGGGNFGGGKVAITHVDPVVVVEVAADTALQAGRHRHALRLLRIRADLVPEDIELA